MSYIKQLQDIKQQIKKLTPEYLRNITIVNGAKSVNKDIDKLRENYLFLRDDYTGRTTAAIADLEDSIESEFPRLYRQVDSAPRNPTKIQVEDAKVFFMTPTQRKQFEEQKIQELKKSIHKRKEDMQERLVTKLVEQLVAPNKSKRLELKIFDLGAKPIEKATLPPFKNKQLAENVQEYLNMDEIWGINPPRTKKPIAAAAYKAAKSKKRPPPVPAKSEAVKQRYKELYTKPTIVLREGKKKAGEKILTIEQKIERIRKAFKEQPITQVEREFVQQRIAKATRKKQPPPIPPKSETVKQLYKLFTTKPIVKSRERRMIPIRLQEEPKKLSPDEDIGKVALQTLLSGFNTILNIKSPEELLDILNEQAKSDLLTLNKFYNHYSAQINISKSKKQKLLFNKARAKIALYLFLSYEQLPKEYQTALRTDLEQIYEKVPPMSEIIKKMNKYVNVVEIEIARLYRAAEKQYEADYKAYVNQFPKTLTKKSI